MEVLCDPDHHVVINQMMNHIFLKHIVQRYILSSNHHVYHVYDQLKFVVHHMNRVLIIGNQNCNASAEGRSSKYFRQTTILPY